MFGLIASPQPAARIFPRVNFAAWINKILLAAQIDLTGRPIAQTHGLVSLSHLWAIWRLPWVRRTVRDSN
jgi:hypothetical protein